LWPNYPPRHPSMPPGQIYSRLPPNGVGRKAPRKSAASNNEALRSSGGANPAQRRASKQEYRQRLDTPAQQVLHNGIPLAQGNALRGYHSSVKSLQALQATQGASHEPSEATSRIQQTRTNTANRSQVKVPARGRRAILEEDDEYVNGNEAIPSIEIDPTSSPAPLAASTRTRNSQVGISNEYVQPRSKYEHAVPKGLRKIQRAVGDDNWTEYLTLLEKKILGNITEQEFTAQSTALFMVFDDERTRARIEKRIVVEVVTPMIEQEQNWD
ncbi:hypothetical protein DE146DRAFT_574062, partial [Phaeosphaeria sp. MPI-PUGE-AT-0046c]